MITDLGVFNFPFPRLSAYLKRGEKEASVSSWFWLSFALWVDTKLYILTENYPKEKWTAVRIIAKRETWWPKKQDKSFMKKIICSICVVKSQNSIPKRIKSRNFDICTLMYTAALFITAKRWKRLKHLSANERINECNINI